MVQEYSGMFGRDSRPLIEDIKSGWKSLVETLTAGISPDVPKAAQPQRGMSFPNKLPLPATQRWNTATFRPPEPRPTPTFQPPARQFPWTQQSSRGQGPAAWSLATSTPTFRPTPTPMIFSGDWRKLVKPSQQATDEANGMSNTYGSDSTYGPAGGLMGNILDLARQHGLPPQVVQAILLTEDGLTGKAGDHGQSFGPFQFYGGGGQLNIFAQENGFGDDWRAAGQYVLSNPTAAADWALRPGGYLGDTIRRGMGMGLTGAELAVYAQKYGQVSEYPEKAGQLYNSQPLDLVPNQFSSGLDTQTAYAACGPAAAIAFARQNGRNPTMQEAVQLAKKVGWTPQQGMAGIESQKALLSSMGVASRIDYSSNRNSIRQTVSSGAPVIISTPGHYYVAQAYDPNTQRYYVGSSGTAYKDGSEWMTIPQMEQLGGLVKGALYMDRASRTGAD